MKKRIEDVLLFVVLLVCLVLAGCTHDDSSSGSSSADHPVGSVFFSIGSKSL